MNLALVRHISISTSVGVLPFLPVRKLSKLETENTIPKCSARKSLLLKHTYFSDIDLYLGYRLFNIIIEKFRMKHTRSKSQSSHSHIPFHALPA